MWLDWLTTKPQGFSCLCFPMARITGVPPGLASYVDTGDLNSGPQVGVASIYQLESPLLGQQCSSGGGEKPTRVRVAVVLLRLPDSNSEEPISSLSGSL